MNAAVDRQRVICKFDHTWPKHVPEVIARLACGKCLSGDIHIWKKKLRIKQLNFSKERVRFPFCHASLIFLIICSCGQVYTTSFTRHSPCDFKAQKTCDTHKNTLNSSLDSGGLKDFKILIVHFTEPYLHTSILSQWLTVPLRSINP